MTESKPPNEIVTANREQCRVKHLASIDFTITAKPSDGAPDCVWEFEAFEIFSREPELLWNLPSGSRPDPTDELAKAERFLHGSIKWDHCSNWHFDIQDDCMIHFCEPEQGEAIGQLFRELYQWAAELIPDWDEYA